MSEQAISVSNEASAQRVPLGKRIWRLYVAFQRPILSISGLLVFFLAWEYVGTSGLINPLFVSAPSKILAAAVRMVQQGDLWNDLYVSGTEFFIGFALAILVGIPLGMLLGWYRTVYYIFDPFVSALNATPRIALTPLFIIWFGIGIWSKVALVFLGAIFPIILNTFSGVRTLDELLLRAARSFGANDRQIFKTIVLPGSVPFILSGLRLGLGRALVGIVVGELVAATAGIGYEMAIAGATFQTDKLFVGVLILTAFGVLFTEGLNRLEHRFDAWRPQHGGEPTA
ncbi:MAG: ABC transporter permease [Chloroflexota bacterium]|nr:ABC transporter permease [Chloroflexota bacterium]